jgi:hypothetical protein
MQKDETTAQKNIEAKCKDRKACKRKGNKRGKRTRKENRHENKRKT